MLSNSRFLVFVFPSFSCIAPRQLGCFGPPEGTILGWLIKRITSFQRLFSDSVGCAVLTTSHYSTSYFFVAAGGGMFGAGPAVAAAAGLLHLHDLFFQVNTFKNDNEALNNFFPPFIFYSLFSPFFLLPSVHLFIRYCFAYLVSNCLPFLEVVQTLSMSRLVFIFSYPHFRTTRCIARRCGTARHVHAAVAPDRDGRRVAAESSAAAPVSAAEPADGGHDETARHEPRTSARPAAESRGI